MQPNNTSDYDSYFSRESLELKRLINIARGAPTGEWPPEDSFWLRLLEDLNFAILHDELDAVAHVKPRFHTVELLPLWGFLTKPKRIDDTRWEQLRDACTRWAGVRGLTLPKVGRIATLHAQTQCKLWMKKRAKKLAREGKPAPRKADLRGEAMAEFPRLAGRGFDEVWAQVAPREWKGSGPKPSQ